MHARPILLAALLVAALTACSSEPSTGALAFDESPNPSVAEQSATSTRPTTRTSVATESTSLPSVVELGSFVKQRSAGNFLWVQPNGETYFGLSEGQSPPIEYSVATGEPITVFDSFDFYQASSADGERLMFLHRLDDQTPQWTMVDRASGEAQLIPWTPMLRDGYGFSSPSLSPTGNLLAISGYATAEAQQARLELVDTTTGESSTLAETLWTDNSSDGVSWARDDSLLALPAGGDLALVDVVERTHRTFPGGDLGSVTTTALSPDGSQLAFTVSREADDQSGLDDDSESPEPALEHALFVVEVDGLTALAEAEQVIDYELNEIEPMWSAEGDQILIYTPYPVTGTPQLRLINPTSGNVQSTNMELPKDADVEGLISFVGPPPVIRESDGAVMFWVQEMLPDVRTWHLRAWIPGE